jgi:hypothetical protein
VFSQRYIGEVFVNGLKWSRITPDSNVNKIIIVGTGPSLVGFDFDKLYGKGFIIAVNDAHQYLPYANAWFTLDPWGLTGTQTPDRNFKGQMWAAVPDDFAQRDAKCPTHRITPLPSIKFLHRISFHTATCTPDDYLQWGLNEDNSCINSLNSGFGALNLAYHMRPQKILLLGMDATSGYFFDQTKKTRPLNFLPWIFESAKIQLDRTNIQVLNGSHISKITCFNKMSPNSALMNF